MAPAQSLVLDSAYPRCVDVSLPPGAHERSVELCLGRAFGAWRGRAADPPTPRSPGDGPCEPPAPADGRDRAVHRGELGGGRAWPSHLEAEAVSPALRSH